MFRSRYFSARYFGALMLGGEGPAAAGADDWLIRFRRRRR